MHIKTIASAAALSVALGFSGFVYAQDAAATTLPTMIGNQQLTPEDAQRVKVRCDDLQTEENQAAGTTETDADADAAATATENEGGEAAVGSVDMDLITVESCLEAGFITNP